MLNNSNLIQVSIKFKIKNGGDNISSELSSAEEISMISNPQLMNACTFIRDSIVGYKRQNDHILMMDNKEVINSCISQAINSLKSIQCKTVPEKTISPEPYLWFHELPENVKFRRMTPEVAALLSSCFGQFWESVFYRLGFTPEVVDLEMQNCSSNPCRAATRLLMRWEHKLTKGANFSALVDQLIRVHRHGSTDIDWVRVQEIMTDDL